MIVERSSNSSRRSLLGAAIALWATAPAAQFLDPDHALLADCREFARIEADLCALIDNCPTLEEEERREAEVEAMLKHQKGIVDRIIQHRALTSAGLCAKAATLLSLTDDIASPEQHTTWDRRIQASLVRDLLDSTSDNPAPVS